MKQEKKLDKGGDLIDPLLAPAPETEEYKIFKQLTMEFDKVTHDPRLMEEYAKKGQDVLDYKTAEKPEEE